MRRKSAEVQGDRERVELNRRPNWKCRFDARPNNKFIAYIHTLVIQRPSIYLYVLCILGMCFVTDLSKKYTYTLTQCTTSTQTHTYTQTRARAQTHTRTHTNASLYTDVATRTHVCTHAFTHSRT